MQNIKQLVERKNNSDTNSSQQKPKMDEENLMKSSAISASLTTKPMKVKKPKIGFKKLTCLGYPKALDTSGRYRKRFGIHVDYVGEDDKVHTKLVKFGKIGDSEYVDHGNEEMRCRIVNRIKQDVTPIQGDFYRFYLLNSTERNIGQAYINLRSALGLSI